MDKFERSNIGRLNIILFCVAIVVLTLGYIILSLGDITISPILLVLGYVVILPLSLLIRFKK